MLTVLALVLSLVAYAATNIGITRPTTFTTLTSTSVNLSVEFNQTNDGAVEYNISIMNSSESSSGPFSLLTSGTLGNASFWNETVTMVDGTRNWIKINITNGSGAIPPGNVNSGVQVFDIDASFLKFQFGGFKTINFTVNEGNLDLTNNLSASHLQVRNTSDFAACDIGALGAIKFNATNGFVGCNGTGWVSFLTR